MTNLSDALSEVGYPVAYYPELARFFGSIPAAILFQQLFFWSQRAKHEYIFKDSKELEEETGLSYKEQTTARRILTTKGILEESYARLEHKMHFALNLEILNKQWGKYKAEKGASPQRDDGQSPKGMMANRLKGGSRTARKGFGEPPERGLANRPKGGSISIDYSENTPETTKSAFSSRKGKRTPSKKEKIPREDKSSRGREEESNPPNPPSLNVRNALQIITEELPKGWVMAKAKKDYHFVRLTAMIQQVGEEVFRSYTRWYFKSKGKDVWEKYGIGLFCKKEMLEVDFLRGEAARNKPKRYLDTRSPERMAEWRKEEAEFEKRWREETKRLKKIGLK